LVDPLDEALPFPRFSVVVARGPFDVAGDVALMRDHRVDLVVAKNAGGSGASAKLVAARMLSLPVLMIDRPVVAARREVDSVQEVLDWLDHSGTERGV
jgi:precorrin-6A/cobalt-precorrin-6A reductase